MAYIPLATGNSWTYKMKDGQQYTNAVTSAAGNEFCLSNSMFNSSNNLRIEGDDYVTDSFEKGNFQVLLKEHPAAGDSWEVCFNANGFDNLLVMTVKQTGISTEVEGKTYNDVLMIEAESKMHLNGSLMSLNFFTQYYYAQGVGLVLTTSSAGDAHALTELKIMNEA
jgi:hypothetical protein